MGKSNHEGPYVLGISASHNGAACLLHGSRIVTAIQEERLTRRKWHRIWGSDPALAIEYCLRAGGISPDALSMICLCPQKWGGRPVHDLNLNPTLRPASLGVPYQRIPHHFAHAVSTYVASGFQDAAVLVVDGVGSDLNDMREDEQLLLKAKSPEARETISLYDAANTTFVPLAKQVVDGELWLGREAWLGKRCPYMPAFHSLGGMYGAVAAQIFGDEAEAGKVMGLAAYGRPTFPPESFFTIINGQFVFTNEVRQHFRHAGRWPAHREEYCNLAASVQQALEIALFELLRQLQDLSSSKRLCFTGGVALNSVANQKIFRDAGFDEIFILPASDDSGPALGAAYYGLWQLGVRPEPHALRTDALGQAYSDDEVSNAVGNAPAVVTRPAEDLVRDVSELLRCGRIVGWFQGGSELGPRALGQRSILLDPRMEEGKDILNARVKFRESFRPYAVSILRSEVENWFDLEGTSDDSPFILRVLKRRQDKRRLVPAVVHEDGTGRIQTLTEEDGLFHDLVCEFFEHTGMPFLLNTSFNVMGEPIIETPEDALWALISTGLDCCVIHQQIVRRREGFASILDLFPRHCFEQLWIDVTDNIIDASILSPKHTTFERSTRWGRITATLETEGAWKLLPYIDGNRHGYDILSALNTKYGPSAELSSPEKLIATLSALRREGAITFSDQPKDDLPKDLARRINEY